MQRFDHTNEIGMNALASIVNFVAIKGSLAQRFLYFQPILF